jgi:hypothetical protein
MLIKEELQNISDSLKRIRESISIKGDSSISVDSLISEVDAMMASPEVESKFPTVDDVGNMVLGMLGIAPLKDIEVPTYNYRPLSTEPYQNGANTFTCKIGYIDGPTFLINITEDTAKVA